MQTDSKKHETPTDANNVIAFNVQVLLSVVAFEKPKFRI